MDADGTYVRGHFVKHHFADMHAAVLHEGKVQSFNEFDALFVKKEPGLIRMCRFLDGCNADEGRTRWDRLHFLNLTLIIFLNCYGLDFRQTDDGKMIEAATKPRTSAHLASYFNLPNEYRLSDNVQVARYRKILSDRQQL